jgi:hypothetical protein
MRGEKRKENKRRGHKRGGEETHPIVTAAACVTTRT